MRRQRGLSERTIPHCWRLADRFLEFRFGDAVGNLSEITLTDISTMIYAKLDVAGLRSIAQPWPISGGTH